MYIVYLCVCVCVCVCVYTHYRYKHTHLSCTQPASPGTEDLFSPPVYL